MPGIRIPDGRSKTVAKMTSQQLQPYSKVIEGRYFDFLAQFDMEELLDKMDDKAMDALRRKLRFIKLEANSTLALVPCKKVTG